MTKMEWVAIYISSNGQLTTATRETREFWNKETKTIDKETMPTTYVGHVQMKIAPKPKDKE